MNQACSRDRSRSRSGSAAAVAGNDGLTEGLLQYLDEGSCGFDGQGSGRPAQETPPVQPRSASREKAGGHASQTTGLGRRGRAAPKPSTAGASHVTEVLVSGEQGGGDVEPSRRNEDGNSAKVGQMSRKKLDVKQTDKENLVEGVGARLQKRSKREQPRSGLANGSDNSSDMSISSTQQFLQPRPVLTRTYGRRSRTRSSFDTKVADWMATLPVNQNSANEQMVDEQAANEQIADEQTANEHVTKKQTRNEQMTNSMSNDQHPEHEHVTKKQTRNEQMTNSMSNDQHPEHEHVTKKQTRNEQMTNSMSNDQHPEHEHVTKKQTRNEQMTNSMSNDQHPEHEHVTKKQTRNEQMTNSMSNDQHPEHEHVTKKQTRNEQMTNSMSNDQHPEHEQPGGQEQSDRGQLKHREMEMQKKLLLLRLWSPAGQGASMERTAVFCRMKTLPSLAAACPSPVKSPCSPHPFGRREFLRGERLQQVKTFTHPGTFARTTRQQQTRMCSS